MTIGLCCSVWAIAEQGVNVTVKNSAGDQVALYYKSHALVIGVSDYDNGWPKLRGVKEDVPAVKAALEKQGFIVTVVMNPDRDELDKAFRNFISLHGNEIENRLLFYFAGHGHSMKLGYGGMMGYLVGRDAPNPNTDKIGFKRKALSMEVVETYARNIESKHALFMFDSCFSGSIFDATRAIPDIIQAKTGMPVRQFITSGAADQQVPDKSIFRRQFVEALTGEGDQNGDGYLTGSELGSFLEAKVTNYSRQSQTPQYGKLRDPLLDKGDFVFVTPSALAMKNSPPTSRISPALRGGVDKETVFWKSIEGSKDVSMFEAYLTQYPTGSFAPLARAKIKKLNTPSSLKPKDASAESLLDLWEPKSGFDGRVGQIEFTNPSLYAIQVHLWHPDSKSRFATWSVPGQSSKRLEHRGQPIHIGSDWGIQAGGRKVPVRTVKDVAKWSSTAGETVWSVSPDSFY